MRRVEVNYDELDYFGCLDLALVVSFAEYGPRPDDALALLKRHVKLSLLNRRIRAHFLWRLGAGALTPLFQALWPNVIEPAGLCYSDTNLRFNVFFYDNWLRRADGDISVGSDDDARYYRDYSTSSDSDDDDDALPRYGFEAWAKYQHRVLWPSFATVAPLCDFEEPLYVTALHQSRTAETLRYLPHLLSGVNVRSYPVHAFRFIGVALKQYWTVRKHLCYIANFQQLLPAVNLMCLCCALMRLKYAHAAWREARTAHATVYNGAISALLSCITKCQALVRYRRASNASKRAATARRQKKALLDQQ